MSSRIGAAALCLAFTNQTLALTPIARSHEAHPASSFDSYWLDMTHPCHGVGRCPGLRASSRANRRRCKGLRRLQLVPVFAATLVLGGERSGVSPEVIETADPNARAWGLEGTVDAATSSNQFSAHKSHSLRMGTWSSGQ